MNQDELEGKVMLRTIITTAIIAFIVVSVIVSTWVPAITMLSVASVMLFIFGIQKFWRWYLEKK